MLKKADRQMTCDAKGCKNDALHCFEIKGHLKKVFLCNDCQKKLFDSLSKRCVSKSPKNKISSVMDEKRGVTSDR